jgi:hypothetical protein
MQYKFIIENKRLVLQMIIAGGEAFPQKIFPVKPYPES